MLSYVNTATVPPVGDTTFFKRATSWINVLATLTSRERRKGKKEYGLRLTKNNVIVLECLATDKPHPKSGRTMDGNENSFGNRNRKNGIKNVGVKSKQ